MILLFRHFCIFRRFGLAIQVLGSEKVSGFLSGGKHAVYLGRKAGVRVDFNAGGCRQIVKDDDETVLVGGRYHKRDQQHISPVTQQQHPTPAQIRRG